MTNSEYVSGLRKLADWYEENEGVALPESVITVYGAHSKEEAAHLLRALAPCEKTYSDGLFEIRKTFDGIKLRFVFMREAVCERIVVSTEVVPEKIEPAYTREVVEWRCYEPIMGAV